MSSILLCSSKLYHTDDQCRACHHYAQFVISGFPTNVALLYNSKPNSIIFHRQTWSITIRLRVKPHDAKNYLSRFSQTSRLFLIRDEKRHKMVDHSNFSQQRKILCWRMRRLSRDLTWDCAPV